MVDLEGTASLMVSYAISLADLVVIPVQGSQLDAKQAARQIALLRAQEKVLRRPIPFAVLLTRTNPAINPRTLRHIEERLEAERMPVLETRLHDREAFRALFSYGGTLPGLTDHGIGNLAAARANASALAAELIGLLTKKSARRKETTA